MPKSYDYSMNIFISIYFRTLFSSDANFEDLFSLDPAFGDFHSPATVLPENIHDIVSFYTLDWHTN